MKIVTDLSNSFNPYPKDTVKSKKETTQIKKKSTKLSKKEKKRTSILQKSKKCFICGTETELDIHEAFGGRNRKKSMEYGLIVYLCRKHHREIEDDEKSKKQLKKYAECIFNGKYGKEKFIKECEKSNL